MAFLDGIFGKPAAQQQAPQQQAPQQQAPAAAAGGGSGNAMSQQTPANPAANPQAMMGAQQQPNAGGPVNPLDSFVGMFQPAQRDPNAQAQPTLADPLLQPLDPAQFKQQVNQANFAAAIPQEMLQKAMSGDAQAFAEAINTAAREAFSAAAQLSHGLAEHGARTAAQRLDAGLDGRIKQYQIKSQNTSNQALAHPAVAPMLNAAKMMIAQSNPQLSPEQIQSQAEQYFTQMADVLVAPKQQAQAKSNAPKETDFSSYLFG
jgi:hypothetical protein